MKSCAVDKLIWNISGVAIITPGLPPKLSSLATASPMVRETESVPGQTLKGIYSCEYIIANYLEH